MISFPGWRAQALRRGGAAVDPITAAILQYGGFWVDPDYAGALTLNTQPDNTNTDFHDGSAWSTGANIAIGSGVATVSPSASARSLYASDGISGNRVTIAYDVPTYTAGAVGGICAAGAPFATHSAAGSYVDEGTASAAFFGVYADAAANCTIDNVVRRNLSIASVAPRLVSPAFAGLTFAQATAAAMPWKGTTLVNGKQAIQFDGGADRLAGSLAAASYKALHAAAGFTAVFAISPDTEATAENVILDTCNNSAAAHGVHLTFDTANQAIIVRVANGSGTFVINKATANGSCTRNATHVVDVTWSEAAGVSIVIDGGAATTDASVGNASTSDPAGLNLGSTTGGANFWSGKLGMGVVTLGVATSLAGMRAQVRAWAGV